MPLALRGLDGRIPRRFHKGPTHTRSALRLCGITYLSIFGLPCGPDAPQQRPKLNVRRFGVADYTTSFLLRLWNRWPSAPLHWPTRGQSTPRRGVAATEARRVMPAWRVLIRVTRERGRMGDMQRLHEKGFVKMCAMARHRGEQRLHSGRIHARAQEFIFRNPALGRVVGGACADMGRFCHWGKPLRSKRTQT